MKKLIERLQKKAQRKKKIFEIISFLRKATEKELADYDFDFWPHSSLELDLILEALSDRQHDYGTSVYAMSISALAAFHYQAHKVGATGFQASCAEMDFISRSRSIKGGFRILRNDDLLYPQNLYKWQVMTIDKETMDWLKEQADKKLKENLHRRVSDKVRQHWQSLSDGVPPPGMIVKTEHKD